MIDLYPDLPSADIAALLLRTPTVVEQTMTERPILFSGPMVRALLDGSKTQTRRVVKCHVEDYGGILHTKTVCPYGQPGDRLWVRESIDGIWGCDAHYIADEAHLSEYIKDWWDTPQRLPCKKIPSIHMPRWASRITLEVTGVRVERLQDISHQDAIAEGGVEVAGGWWSHDGTTMDTPGDTNLGGTAVDSYRVLWESINAANRPKLPSNHRSKRYARVKAWLDKHPDTSSWDANPWVWVVEFRRVVAT